MLRSGLPTSEERRGLPFDDAGIDIRDDGANQRFHGYSAVFDTRTAIGNPLKWGFYEEIAQGTFSKTLTEGDARMLIDHDTYYIVSRVSAGTLLLSQDQRGLLADSALNTGLSYVADLRTNVAVRNITGMSFGFQVTKDDWHTEKVSTSDGNDAEVEVRVIREVKLFEVSAVTFPAYEETTAGLRHSLVPALVRRGDQDAIARAARHRPELASLLGYDPDLAPTHIDLAASSGAASRQDSEPAETTRTPAEQHDQAHDPEPAASTRCFESELYRARARAEAIRLRAVALAS